VKEKGEAKKTAKEEEDAVGGEEKMEANGDDYREEEVVGKKRGESTPGFGSSKATGKC
jgi:hypothetical protein